jgi:predicted aspartyl protease
MGITYVEGVATGPNGKQARLRFLVGSGASHTLLPNDVCTDLGLKPKRKLAFSLADGTQVERSISECHLSVGDSEGRTPVIMGEPGDQPLLGVVTLEIFGLVFHPFKRTLEPIRMILA